MRSFGTWSALGVLVLCAGSTRAAEAPADPKGGAQAADPSAPHLTLRDALRMARAAAPELAEAKAREAAARAEVGVAGLYPNPSLSAATNTQTARISGTVSLPLVVLGQRGAAVEAAQAEERTVRLDGQVVWNDVRRSVERAYLALWLAQEVTAAREDSARIEAQLEGVIAQRVEVGSAPEVDALRVHAERLRADADAIEAAAREAAGAAELGRWIGGAGDRPARADGAPPVPEELPALATLLTRAGEGTPVARERADAAAAEARARRERADARPGMTLDVGFDALDPTIQDVTNYRAQLTLDVPLFHQRGPMAERELALAGVARARARAAQAEATAALTAGYRSYEAATFRERTLAEGLLPAAVAAAKASEEAYALGRAPLLSVLDAERALIDARLSALQAQAARAEAWSEIEHALGAP